MVWFKARQCAFCILRPFSLQSVECELQCLFVFSIYPGWKAIVAFDCNQQYKKKAQFTVTDSDSDSDENTRVS